MIHIENLKYKYQGAKQYVFDNFSLNLEDNNIYGLLGKNGTGKSTLLYLISGMLRRTAGTITVDGVDTQRHQAETLEEIFLVPEEFDLAPMTLEAYVRLNQPFYPRFSREVLESCLRDFELTPDIHLKELSMGQKKKVYMSFALAANTKLLLMDEPTNGLDIPSKSQFRRVVANNMSDDRTMVTRRSPTSARSTTSSTVHLESLPTTCSTPSRRYRATPSSHANARATRTHSSTWNCCSTQ